MRNPLAKGNTLSLRNRKVRFNHPTSEPFLSLAELARFDSQFENLQQTFDLELRKKPNRLLIRKPNGIRKQLKVSNRVKHKLGKRESQSIRSLHSKPLNNLASKAGKECDQINGRFFNQEKTHEWDEESVVEDSSASTTASVVQMKQGYLSSPTHQDFQYRPKMPIFRKKEPKKQRCPIDQRLKKEQFLLEPQDDKEEQVIKLKGLKDKRKKEEFKLVFEGDYPSLFRHPCIKKAKLIQHQVDNDYPSDSEQVQTNIKTLKDELEQAITAFVRRDPLMQIQNLADDLSKLTLHSQQTNLDCDDDATMADEHKQTPQEASFEKPPAGVTRRVTRNQHMLNL